MPLRVAACLVVPASRLVTNGHLGVFVAPTRQTNEPADTNHQITGKRRFLKTVRVAMVIFVLASLYGAYWSLHAYFNHESTIDALGVEVSGVQQLHRAIWLMMLTFSCGSLWWYLGRVALRMRNQR